MTVCPKCKGYGIVGSAVPDILRGRGAIFSSNECDMCHGSGEVPMTNEEWFCGLSTEEKAEWLCSKEYYCEFIDGCNYCPLFEADKHRCLDLSNKELWELWLKEIHK